MKFFNKCHYQNLESKRLKWIFDKNYKNSDVLDVGCGQGKYLKILNNSCKKIIGVDSNKEQVNDLRNQGFNAFTPEELPTGQEYDVILMSHLIEHLEPLELSSQLDYYLSMLKIDGVLIVITPLPGIRFWYDFTHIRPYTPQSLGMMFGIIDGPSAFKSKIKMELTDTWFFKDCFRIRNQRHYYPQKIKTESSVKKYLNIKLISISNIIFAVLFLISNGVIGIKSSWLGIYQKIK